MFKKEFIQRPFREGNALMQLIYINVGIFVIIQVLNVALRLFNINFQAFTHNLMLPSSFAILWQTPWTIITYMFLHFKFWHLFFNMLCLYWFGQIFMYNFTKKQLTGLYLLGGIVGGLFYILCYRYLPYFSYKSSVLCGASASITALIVAAAFAQPNMPLRLLFIGEIKLKFVAALTVLISIFGMTGDNAGGEIAHLGGAIAGWLWFVTLRKGKDLTVPFDKMISFLVNVYNKIFNRKKTLKVTSNRDYHYKPDEQYNMERKKNNERMDEILDKIRKSGYASLTEEDRKELFDISGKL
jgi:membrane associated rhomboid family serine protease